MPGSRPCTRTTASGATAATLAAQSGVTVFGIAFTQWIRAGEHRSLADIAAAVLRELLTLTSGYDGLEPSEPESGTSGAAAR